MRRRPKMDAMRSAITTSVRTRSAVSVWVQNTIGRAMRQMHSGIWQSLTRSRRLIPEGLGDRHHHASVLTGRTESFGTRRLEWLTLYEPHAPYAVTTPWLRSLRPPHASDLKKRAPAWLPANAPGIHLAARLRSNERCRSRRIRGMAARQIHQRCSRDSNSDRSCLASESRLS